MFPNRMPATPETPRPRPRVIRADVPEPLRRRRAPAAAGHSPVWRRALNFLLVFAAVVLLADALVGERGLVATTRARRVSDDAAEKVERLRRENRQLRDAAKRLREDPTTIESLAREELGLIRQGEVLVVVKDRKPAGK
jgi:cell division protein FtsB